MIDIDHMIAKDTGMSSEADLLQTLPRGEDALISLVREGLPARCVITLQEAMAVTQETVAGLIQVPASTLRRKIRKDEKLEPSASERIVELRRLCDFGHSVLGSAEAFRTWLKQPVLALGRERPLELLDTHLGTRWVYDTLGRIEHGVFA